MNVDRRNGHHTVPHVTAGRHTGGCGLVGTGGSAALALFVGLLGLPGGLGPAGCVTGIGQQGGNQVSARIVNNDLHSSIGQGQSAFIHHVGLNHHGVAGIVGWGGKGVRGDTERNATKLLGSILVAIVGSRGAAEVVELARPLPPDSGTGLVCPHCQFAQVGKSAFFCPKCGMRLLRG